jgi:hypothetical protein
MSARAQPDSHSRPQSAAVVLLAGIALIGLPAAQGRAPGLPAELSDKNFWQLIVDLSEPDGYFEDENFVSNETGFQRVMPRLQNAVKPGGVYVDVGPERSSGQRRGNALRSGPRSERRCSDS